MSKGLMGNPTDVAPAVQAVKNTGGKAQGEADTKMTMRKESAAARMVANKGRSAGRKIASNAGKKMVAGTTPDSQPHMQSWGK